MERRRSIAETRGPSGRQQGGITHPAVAIELVEPRVERHAHGFDRLANGPPAQADLLQDDPLAMDEVPR
jgi:hypothetical protein